MINLVVVGVIEMSRSEVILERLRRVDAGLRRVEKMASLLVQVKV